MSEAPDQPFIRHFKMGFAAASGAIAAVALALSIAFVVDGLMGARAERQSAAEIEQMREDLLDAIEEMKAREAAPEQTP